ncbi:MAG: TIGR00282 family metallophosphoesterase [Clostridiaceae bacterium]|nr:TIGR00282 family metallophosphoesterase [Clostridiaceae bacterium]
MKILFIGDIFAKQGVLTVQKGLSKLKNEIRWDYCIANGENAAAGKGINGRIASELYDMGVDGITLGNHVWARDEILYSIDSDPYMARPANYSKQSPGRGRFILDGKAGPLAVINLSGRVYMQPCNCPFETCEEELPKIKEITKSVLVDFHGEATSEKCAFAWHFDGRVSAVAGTHTHVQTADERILPFGTAFITDVGMTGPGEGILGTDRDSSISRFVTGMPVKFSPQKGEMIFNGAHIEIDDKTGKALRINRLNFTLRLDD